MEKSGSLGAFPVLSRQMGRSTDYRLEIAEAICGLLIEGLSLREIGAREDMPHERTLYRWLADSEEFRQKYAQARELQAERYAAEIIEISDDGTNDWMDRREGDETVRVVDHEHIQRSKLRVDARKWAASKLLPKKYGDRTELVGAGGKDLIPETDQSKLALALLTVLHGGKKAR
jgi:hypothetical protein